MNPDELRDPMKHSTKTRRTLVSTPGSVSASRSLRDTELVHALSVCVRTMSLSQIARTWWPDALGMASCRSRVTQLAENGSVELFRMMAHPEIPLAAPLAVWRPGQETPAFGPIAHRARTRWPAVSVSTELVIATRPAASNAGGCGGRRPRTSEATHDLHLASVYLAMRQQLPTRTRTWRSEAMLALTTEPKRVTCRPSAKCPDAIVQDGRAYTAIEFVGDYSTAKLADFHEHCRRNGLGYELW